MGVEFATPEAADGNQTKVSLCRGKWICQRVCSRVSGSGDMVAEVSGRAVVLAVGGFCCGFLLLVGLDGLLGGGHDGVWL